MNKDAAETDAPSTEETASRLLDAVSAVVDDLRSGAGAPAVGLDSALDRELGLDSLGRVELMARLETEFDVTLSETLVANSENPRDLLRAVLGADSRRGGGTAPDITRLDLERVESAPDSARTLIEVLDWHVRTHPDRPHIRLFDDDGADTVITYGDLRAGAEAVAVGLQQRGLETGQAVVIMLPTEEDYFFAFFGALLAGGVPVPVYPPGRIAQVEDHLRRHGAIIDNCRGRFLITVDEAIPFGRLLTPLAEALEAVVTVAELAGSAGEYAAPVLGGGDTGFLQYTSGSTGMPKGVILSHDNLLANIRSMGAVIQPRDDDVLVSWLPLYHDMGLIGAWLGTLYYAIPVVIMPPLSFLARPRRWMEAIHRYRGTLSAAPNFAYDLCLRRLGDEDMEGLDLSSWRLVLNGAEAVSADTTRRFCERFAAWGFDPGAMTPVYGLAENSVALGFPPLGEGLVVDRVRRHAMAETGRAEPADADDDTALEFVRSGRPIPGHEIRIVDGAGRELPDRRQGRLQFRGPSSTAGYFRNAEATKELFDGDWLESGDLAYAAGGDIYITGRIKDIIIRAGRNIYPNELEETVGDLDGVHQGNVAVFGSADPRTGTERLVVLAESRRRDETVRADLLAAITAAATDLMGAPPDDVVLAPPNTVLRTSSGKVRRAATRDLYEQGLIGKARRSVRWQIVRLALAGVGPRLRRAWESGIAVAYAAWAWTVLAVLVVPTWLLVAVLPGEAAPWNAARGAVRLLFALLGIRIRVQGAENLPHDGQPVVLVCNHSSYIDGPVLVAALPRSARFVAKGELTGSFVTRVFLERIGALFVERFDTEKSVADARAVAQAADAGRPLVFFPEGTFRRMAGLLPFHMGAFTVAVDADALVIPLIMRGTRSILREKSAFPRRGAITITIDKPIPPPAGEEAWAAAIGLRDETRRRILARTGEPDLAHERPEVVAKVL